MGYEGVRCLWLWSSGGSYPQALQAAKQWLRLGVDVRHNSRLRYRGGQSAHPQRLARAGEQARAVPGSR